MQITPRPFGEVIGEGMTILGRVWRRFLAPAFWTSILLGALTIAIVVATGAGDVLQLILTDPEVLESYTREELIETTLTLFQAGFLSVLLQLLGTGFINLTVHRLVGSEIAGEPLGPREATSKAFGRLLVLVVAGFLAFVSVFLGLIALIIPGLWLAGCFTMISPVIALENVGPVAALRRSFALVRGRWWPTIGFVLLVGLLGSVAAQLVQLIAIPILAAGDVGIGTGLGFVVIVVVQDLVIAAIAVMTTVWYIDLRARKEPLLTSNLS
ncbi:MAG: hypothetical protein M3N43_00385 [Actinomycetota bacterium]|nr:hypothetical protein [Actinomycetota bacterium]